MSTYAARFYEGRYIQGQIAAKMSKSGIIGYIVSFPIPEVISNINATMLGAQSVNPNMKVKIVWVNSWFDPGKEADAAKALIDQGADILTQHTDSPAATQVAEERGIHSFGESTDMIKFGAACAIDRQHRLLGRLLHRSAPRTCSTASGRRRHLGRAGFRHGRDGALYQHARRREEDGDGHGSRRSTPASSIPSNARSWIRTARRLSARAATISTRARS